MKTELVPELRFPEFKEEWIQKKLQEISISYFQGINTAADNLKYITNGVPILQAKHITSEVLNFADTKFVSESNYLKYKSKYQPEINEILISNIGTLGKILLVNKSEEFLIAWNIFKIKLNTRLVNPKFVSFNLKKYSLNGYFESVQSGNATKFVNKSEILAINFFLPDLKEQTKIAEFLSVVDKRIEQLTEKKKLLEQYKNGVMQQIFSQQIRFRDDHGQPYPAWQEKKLGEICIINPKANNLPLVFNYIDLESVEKGQLLKTEIISKLNAPSRAQRLLQKNDILFQTVRPYQMNNLYFYLDGQYVASTGYALIRANNLNSKFLFQLLHNQRFVNLVIEKCTGSNYPAINTWDLSNINISFPTHIEQNKIAEYLTDLDNVTKLNSELIKLSIEYKKSLLQQMFI